MEPPTIAGGGFAEVPVERLFSLVDDRHGVDFIPAIKVEEQHMVGNGIQ